MANPVRGREYVAVGVGVVVRRDGHLLMSQRKNAHGTGDYAFPGGNLRVGESFEQCAARELLEETTLRAERFRVLGVTNDLYPDGLHYITVFVEALHFEGEPRVTEPDKVVGDWTWVPADHLPGNLFLAIRNLLAMDADSLSGDDA